MTQRTRISLVGIQTMIAVLTLLMFAAGLFGLRVTEKTEERLRKSSDVRIDEKMRPFIGEPYSEGTHYQLLELMRTSSEVNASSNKALTAASEAMRNLGGLVTFAALTSMFLLLRKQRPRKQPEQVGHS